MAAHVNPEQTVSITSTEYMGLQEKKSDINEICETLKDRIDIGENEHDVSSSNSNTIVQDQTSGPKTVVPNGCVKPILKIDEISKNSLNVTLVENGCSNRPSDMPCGVTLDSSNRICSTQSHLGVEHEHKCDNPSKEEQDTPTEKDCNNSSDVTVLDRTENVDDLTKNMPKVEPVTVGALKYVVYESELQMPDIMRLITKDLSEPYSIYTYRYFIHNWPKLCFLVRICYIFLA